MPSLIEELKIRHDIAQSKYCADFLYALCDYMDLLAMHPELNKLLLQNHKTFARDDFQNIWEPYASLLMEVYEPIRTKPESAKEKFNSFFWLTELDRRPFFLAGNPWVWKAVWQRRIYKKRLKKIHERVLVMLSNKHHFDTPEPALAPQPALVRETLQPPAKKIKPPYYDADKGYLYVLGFEVKIRRQAKYTYEHQLLIHIFIDNKKDISQEFDYSSLPFDHDVIQEKETLWSRCRTVCIAINNKVSKASNGTVDNFLIFNTRINGWLNINPKYLDP